MLTMDQDSRFNENCFPQFINYIRNSENHSVAVFCSNYDNLDQTKESIELWAAITSGSIYPLAMFSNELRFREDFLIDVIDVEYCLHAREKGYKTLCFTGVRLVHELGYAKKTKFKFELNNYSAQRTYYIIRNIRLNWHLHPGEIPPKAKYNFYKYKVIYRIAKIMFEDHSLLKCKAIFLGLLHGKLLKGGKYDIV